MAPHFEQAAYRVRFERGECGLRAIAPDASVLVIVDVLSFSTAVDVATTAGAFVKATSQETDAREDAKRHGAFYAVPRTQRSREMPYSLSPDTLAALPSGARLILPSPNGATLIAQARQFSETTIVAACLRNATAVGRFIRDRFDGGIVAVIAAGERWPDGSMRASLEDDVGAGAILSCLNLEAASPEAAFAAQGFFSARTRISSILEASVSGRELIASGYRNDVERASELDISPTVPLVGEDGFFADANRRR
jgi:2-phosphosulfolactate phosphatase